MVLKVYLARSVTTISRCRELRVLYESIGSVALCSLEGRRAHQASGGGGLYVRRPQLHTIAARCEDYTLTPRRDD